MSNQINQCWRQSLATQRKESGLHGEASRESPHVPVCTCPCMEPCIYNATPDVRKEDSFHEFYPSRSKENEVQEWKRK